jgi:hypothetical protein
MEDRDCWYIRRAARSWTRKLGLAERTIMTIPVQYEQVRTKVQVVLLAS